ncbi:hypothetical protein TE10_21320 [Raoultella ornithinolytica]|uniref:hypothetical protein n=1 Tax=Raoultella terrigena TaxID=577 RepID=UPI0005982E59|nr:hypothetical protein [Raoultella terrigena]AJF74430.1 hypothetical protein TE10_21320 [Raoultella ornithinolytica]HCR56513.1 hypothetical protein [Raoultella sp.]
MIKSVAQLPLKPINYDGVHALPIDECVKNAAHETDLSILANFTLHARLLVAFLQPKLLRE